VCRSALLAHQSPRRHPTQPTGNPGRSHQAKYLCRTVDLEESTVSIEAMIKRDSIPQMETLPRTCCTNATKYRIFTVSTALSAKHMLQDRIKSRFSGFLLTHIQQPWLKSKGLSCCCRALRRRCIPLHVKIDQLAGNPLY